MKVLVTGATGYVGSAVRDALRLAAHHVIGLARSLRSQAVLEAAGYEALRGDLTDLDLLRAAAAAADTRSPASSLMRLGKISASVTAGPSGPPAPGLRWRPRCDHPRRPPWGGHPTGWLRDIAAARIPAFAMLL